MKTLQHRKQEKQSDGSITVGTDRSGFDTPVLAMKKLEEKAVKKAEKRKKKKMERETSKSEQPGVVLAQVLATKCPEFGKASFQFSFGLRDLNRQLDLLSNIDFHMVVA